MYRSAIPQLQVALPVQAARVHEEERVGQPRCYPRQGVEGGHRPPRSTGSRALRRKHREDDLQSRGESGEVLLAFEEESLCLAHSTDSKA